MVTRAAHQAEELAAPLRALGAEVILLPMIAIAPPDDAKPLIRAAHNADQYDWIVFTSANAVQAFAAHLRQPPIAPKIAVVGAATHHAATEHGLQVALVPERYVAEALAQAFADENLRGKRVLIPRAAVARDVVPDKLRELGAQVEVVEAYRNEMPEASATRAREIFRDPLPDWALFASPSAIQNLATATGTDVLREVKLASIGPITSAAIKAFGLAVTAEADPHTVDGLVQAVLRTHMASLQAAHDENR